MSSQEEPKTVVFTHMLDHNRIAYKGQQPFLYGDVTIWAINKKNADRKAHKNGLI
jgi:hypothetical protein